MSEYKNRTLLRKNVFNWISIVNNYELWKIRGRK